MKKRVLVIVTVLLALSLTAFSVFKGNNATSYSEEISDSKIEKVDLTEHELHVVHHNPFFMTLDKEDKSDFFIGIGTRFNGLKKETLNEVRSFDDLIGKEHAQRIVAYKSLSVIVLDDSEQTEIKITGTGGDFTKAQLELLQSSDYSSNLLISADYKEKNIETGLVEDSYWTPYITVIPETQASYKDGNEALIYYLRDYSLEETSLTQSDKLLPGKLYFTLSKFGTISNVQLRSTSGYTLVDNKLMELILKTSGSWHPAKNAKGETVDQQLVVSFGNMGC